MSSPRIEVPFFPVKDGITDHFRCWSPATLRVFLVVLKHTKHEPTWKGWMVADVAQEADVSERQARRSLHELASGAGDPPRGSDQPRRYIVLAMNRSHEGNWLRVLNWVREPRRTRPQAVDGPVENLSKAVDEGQSHRNRLSGDTGTGCPVTPERAVR